MNKKLYLLVALPFFSISCQLEGINNIAPPAVIKKVMTFLLLVSALLIQ